jgi:hypothetical protein
MAWRIHLTNKSIHQMNILPGKMPVLAIWTRQARVRFFDLASGAHLGDRTLPETPKTARDHARWIAYMAAFIVPELGMYLPFLRLPTMDVFFADDGKLRLYHLGAAETYVELDGEETRLDMGDAETLRALDLDRSLGTIAALDERGRLHLFQQDIPIGVFDIGLRPTPEVNMTLVVARGGGAIFASDGRCLVLTDSGGQVIKRVDTYYQVGNLACSSGGGMVALSDAESGVIRLYKGDDLTPTHQKFALDLMLNALSTQLIADLPPPGTGVKHLVADTHGAIAFTMAGMVCVTDASQMDELPQQIALF